MVNVYMIISWRHFEKPDETMGEGGMVEKGNNMN
jgi:hypothetical protein